NDRTVTWISSAPDTAAVDENGVVTGKKKGKAVITVMTNDGGKTAGCEVTVAEILMLPGEVRRVSLSGNAFIYGVNWSVRYLTNDANGKPVKCVTVKNGVVTAKNLKKGQKSADAIVTAVYGTEMKEFNITVNGTAPENTFYQDGKKKVKLTAPKTLKLKVGDVKKKTVSIGIPALLRDPGKYTLSCSILTGGVCEVAGETFGEFDIDSKYITYNTSGSKATVEVKPVNAGAAYIVWGMEDENGKVTQAVTKVMVKKPVSTVSVNQADDGVTLAVGEGESLEVFTTEDNTDTKDVSFSVKPLANAAGKKVSGVKVSKSGFLMATLPDCAALVTVKCGKTKPVTVKVTVSPWEGEGEYLTLKKTFINVKRPKTGIKTMPIDIASPKKQKDKAQPEIECFIDDEVPESEIRFGKDQKGRYSVSVSSTAKPGCYRVRTVAAEGSGDWNETGFELIVK
ncbi:MAG: Ig domain-containing protein, partial [Lachnospiraceae bacterium]|nr:Ig domain-containing protein [Lachnospiraceae bacterium]